MNSAVRLDVKPEILASCQTPRSASLWNIAILFASGRGRACESAAAVIVLSTSTSLPT